MWPLLCTALTMHEHLQAYVFTWLSQSIKGNKSNAEIICGHLEYEWVRVGCLVRAVHARIPWLSRHVPIVWLFLEACVGLGVSKCFQLGLSTTSLISVNFCCLDSRRGHTEARSFRNSICVLDISILGLNQLVSRYEKREAEKGKERKNKKTSH